MSKIDLKMTELLTFDIVLQSFLSFRPTSGPLPHLHLACEVFSTACEALEISQRQDVERAGDIKHQVVCDGSC